MMDNPDDMHRPTQIFERGNWLVKGKTVTPDVPHALNAFSCQGAPQPAGAGPMAHPSRESAYGPHDGEQGVGTVLWQWPGRDAGRPGRRAYRLRIVHCWITCLYRFMHDDQWSVKKLMRTILLSATYRQDSKVTPTLLEKISFQ